MNKQKIIRRIRTAIISECIKNGISDPNQVKQIIRDTSRSIRPMSIAGVKAAQTKGQYFCFIGE